jgi:hypothetical protein
LYEVHGRENSLYTYYTYAMTPSRWWIEVEEEEQDQRSETDDASKSQCATLSYLFYFYFIFLTVEKRMMTTTQWGEKRLQPFTTANWKIEPIARFLFMKATSC